MELKSASKPLFWISILLGILLLVCLTTIVIVNYSANKLFNAITDNQFNQNGNGNLYIKVLPSPSIMAKNILITDPYSRNTMLTIKNLYFEVTLSALFHHTLIIEKIELNDASILIVKKLSGETNWSVFNSKSDSDSKPEKSYTSTTHENQTELASRAANPTPLKIIVKSIVITNVKVIYQDLAKNTTTQFQLDKLILDNNSKQISIIGPIGKYNDTPFNFNFVFNGVTAEKTYPFTLHAASGDTVAGATGTASSEQLLMKLSVNTAAGEIDGDITLDNKPSVKLNLRSDSLNMDKSIPLIDKKIAVTHDKSFWDLKDVDYHYSGSSHSNSKQDWPYLFVQSLIEVTNGDVSFQANQILYRGVIEKNVNFTAKLKQGNLIVNPCTPIWLNNLGDLWFPKASFRNITNIGITKPDWCS